MPTLYRYTIYRELMHCITCFRSGLDAIGASTKHFVGVVVLWKQMIRCTIIVHRALAERFFRPLLLAAQPTEAQHTFTPTISTQYPRATARRGHQCNIPGCR